MKLVSVIIPVCNQGDRARQTVASVRDAMADMAHEIIVVDDQSIDGSCHAMPRDVLVVRTHRREGVSRARRLGFSQSRGDVIIWTDPHCEFPPRSLRHLAKVARYKQAAVQPRIITAAGGRERWGGKLVVSQRGLRVARSYDRPDTYPALYGTIYAMKRAVYECLDGWPKLPGVWGYSEQAMSLMCWFCGVPIVIEAAYTCLHGSYRPNGSFPYSVGQSDQAQNAHFVHALFFPKTYRCLWKPILDAHFGTRKQFCEPLRSDAFRRQRRRLKRASVRTEEEFFAMILGRPMPAEDDEAAILEFHRQFAANQPARGE